MNRQVIFVSHHPKPLNRKEIDIVRGLSRFWYLTPAQVTRRFWGGKSFTAAHATLKRLADEEYAEVVPFTDRRELRGRRSYAYRLGKRGLHLVRELGEAHPARLYHYRIPENQMPHTLAVNDVLILAELFEREQLPVRLDNFIHEKVLHQKPYQVVFADGKKRGLELDGVLLFAFEDANPDTGQYLFLEVEMSNKRSYWQEKCEHVIAYVQSRFATDFPGAFFTYCVYTPAGETHCLNLRTWTQDVLRAHALTDRDWNERFLFTSMDARTAAPREFFLTPHWLRPFTDEPTVPLEVDPG